MRECVATNNTIQRVLYMIPGNRRERSATALLPFYTTCMYPALRVWGYNSLMSCSELRGITYDRYAAASIFTGRKSNMKSRTNSQRKKLFATLIAVSVVVSLLSGCGGSNGSGGSGGSAGDQQAPAHTASQGAGGSSKDEGAPPTVSDAENTYIILVQDAEDASPISGATVQFCSDTQCMVGRTDATGSASFEVDPGNYTAHVLKVPEGYEASEEEIALSADNRTAVFAIRKAGAAKESGAEAGAETGTE